MRFVEKNIDFIPVLLLAFAPSIRLMLPAANALVLYAILPFLFIWVINDNKRIFRKKNIKYYLYFILWMAISTLFSTNMIHSLTNMRLVGAGFLASIVFYSLSATKSKNGFYLLISYILLFLSTLWYLWGKGELISLDITTERLDDTLVNANDLAYYLFYVVCAVTILFDYYKTKKVWSISILVGLLFVAVWISLITASRQVLFVVIPYIGYCLYYQFYSGEGGISRRVIPLIILAVIALKVVMPRIQNAISGSYLEVRMETKIGEDNRSNILKEAIQIGLAHPVFGVGPGCMIYHSSDGSFSHNSYAELFATTGLPSLIIFLMMICPIVLENRKRYIKTHDTLFSFLFWTCLFWVVYNVLYAFYVSLWLIAFFYLLMGISDRRYYDYLNTR